MSYSDIFTKQSVTSIILPYYGHTHECRELLISLRQGSRKLWFENIKEWSHALSLNKLLKHISLDKPTIVSSILRKDQYATHKYAFTASSK